jgi:electron transport complex protein RnfD
MAQTKYFYELTISSSTHAHSPVTTQTVMRDVLIALTPALLGSIYFFGFRALLVTLVSASACVFFEWIYRKLMKLDSTVWDLSAVVTGVLLAFVCPVTIPYWCIILGDFFAIIVVKQLFGGIGQNFVNPALAARAFMFSWPVLMSTWVKVGFENAAGIFSTADIVTSATPLAPMHQGQMPDVSVMDMFLGNVGGCLGETSAALLLIGLAYLLIRKVISIRIPLAFVATVAVLTFLFPQGNDRLSWMSCQVLGCGLMLGAIFMATDYVTSPITKLGQVIFAVGCGIITVVIRYFGGYNEGVSYAILIMNACAPLLDKIGHPVKFGALKKEGKR